MKAALTLAVVAAAGALLGCSPPPEPAPTSAPTSTGASGTSPVAPTTPGFTAACEQLLPAGTVRGLLGGAPEIGGGKARRTGTITSTRCSWTAPNGRYLTMIVLEGPELTRRIATVGAGGTPVPGRPGVSYDPARGLLVVIDDRLFQVVAGGAGSAQGRLTGLKAVEALRERGR